MNRILVQRLSLCLAFSMGFAATTAVLSAPSAEAVKKKVTITDRIQDLTQKVNAGQKSNELTLDEANDLRKKITKINEKIDKCQSKNGGKLSYKDQNSAEKDLNKVSVKLFEEQLAKRTAKPSH